MFDKKQNELSNILYKYKNIIDYNNIKNKKLRYSVKAQLSGNIHMKKLYLDNAPAEFRWAAHKMKNISGFLYEWSLQNQEEFISKSDWFKTEIQPLIVYDQAGEASKYSETKKVLYGSLFGNDDYFDEFSGQFMFSRFEEEKCLSYVLAFVLFYWNKIELERIFELVKTYYPIQYKRNEPNLERKVLLLLVKWRKKGYLFCKDLRFWPKKKFFISFLEEFGR